MLNSWRQWCRLCAKENGAEIDIFLKNENGNDDLAQALKKFFLITISPYDQCPTMICTTCYKFITNLVLFAEHSSRVETMFTKLLFNEYNMVTIDLNNLKYEYGLTSFLISFRDIKKIDQATDTIDLINNSNKIHQELITEIPLVNISNNSDDEILLTKRERVKRQTQINVPKFKNDETSENKLVIQENPNESNLELSDNTENESTSEDENFVSSFLEIKDEHSDIESESIDLKPIKKRSQNKKSISKRKNSNDESFQCDECEKSFKRKSSLERHIKRFHSSNKETYFCTNCSKEFLTRKGLKQHEAVHFPPERKKERLFVCDECGKTFRANGALKEHKFIHTDETPYECKKCPKKFKYLRLLKKHQTTHEDTFFDCSECGLKLKTRQTLQSHMLVHSDVKKHKCNYCGNAYKRSKALKTHLIIHTGLRPYTCPFCDKTFANGSNCRKHKKLSHPVELAAMEAAGEVQPTINIPKLSQLKATPVISQMKPSLSLERITNNMLTKSSVSTDLVNQQMSLPTITNFIQHQAEISHQLQSLNKTIQLNQDIQNVKNLW